MLRHKTRSGHRVEFGTCPAPRTSSASSSMHGRRSVISDPTKDQALMCKDHTFTGYVVILQQSSRALHSCEWLLFRINCWCTTVRTLTLSSPHGCSQPYHWSLCPWYRITWRLITIIVLLHQPIVIRDVVSALCKREKNLNFK